MLRKVAQLSIASAFASSMILGATPAHAVQSSVALAEVRPVTITGPAFGAAECKITGTFNGSSLTVVLAGEAQATSADVAAVNITCTARQNGWTVMRTSRTMPGAASATAKHQTIPVATTKVCTAGYVVFQDGGIQTFGNENC